MGDIMVNLIINAVGLSPGRAKGIVKSNISEGDLEKIKINSIISKAKVTLSFIILASQNKNIIGIISTSGGICSHWASIVRELKIPSILLEKKEIFILKDGNEIILDGLKGTIEVLSHGNKNN